jgi:hypothetical protein
VATSVFILVTNSKILGQPLYCKIKKCQIAAALSGKFTMAKFNTVA